MKGVGPVLRQVTCIYGLDLVQWYTPVMLSEIDPALACVLINVLDPGPLIPYLEHPRVFGDHLKRRLPSPPLAPLIDTPMQLVINPSPKRVGQTVLRPPRGRSSTPAAPPPRPLRYALPLRSVNPSPPPHPFPRPPLVARPAPPPPSSARPERNVRGLTVDPDREVTAPASLQQVS